MRNLTIKTGVSGSLFGFFNVNGQDYCAAVSEIPFLDYRTECTIFKCKGMDLTDSTPVYSKKHAPVTLASLRQCVSEFIGALLW